MLQAGKSCQKILLILNLLIKVILTGLRLIKDGGGDFRYSDTAHLSRSAEVLKLKIFKKDATLKLFKNGMSMSVQKSQDHKMAKYKMAKRSCLVDDLKIAQNHNVKFKFKEQAQSKKSMITTTYSQEKVKRTS
ncbi:hypothetical protein Tco_1538137 [Tanacetum coccineum]